MALEVKIEETERGFLFKDPTTQIEVVKQGSDYNLIWTDERNETSIRPLEVSSLKKAYNAFVIEIYDYWSGGLGMFFQMNNREKIKELFAPLDAKYGIE
jgi:hypothetical protein